MSVFGIEHFEHSVLLGFYFELRFCEFALGNILYWHKMFGSIFICREKVIKRQSGACIISTNFETTMFDGLYLGAFYLYVYEIW